MIKQKNNYLVGVNGTLMAEDVHYLVDVYQQFLSNIKATSLESSENPLDSFVSIEDRIVHNGNNELFIPFDITKTKMGLVKIIKELSVGDTLTLTGLNKTIPITFDISANTIAGITFDNSGTPTLINYSLNDNAFLTTSEVESEIFVVNTKKQNLQKRETITTEEQNILNQLENSLVQLKQELTLRTNETHINIESNQKYVDVISLISTIDKSESTSLSSYNSKITELVSKLTKFNDIDSIVGKLKETLALESLLNDKFDSELKDGITAAFETFDTVGRSKLSTLLSNILDVKTTITEKLNSYNSIIDYVNGNVAGTLVLQYGVKVNKYLSLNTSFGNLKQQFNSFLLKEVGLNEASTNYDNKSAIVLQANDDTILTESDVVINDILSRTKVFTDKQLHSSDIADIAYSTTKGKKIIIDHLKEFRDLLVDASTNFATQITFIENNSTGIDAYNSNKTGLNKALIDLSNMSTDFTIPASLSADVDSAKILDKSNPNYDTEIAKLNLPTPFANLTTTDAEKLIASKLQENVDEINQLNIDFPANHDKLNSFTVKTDMGFTIRKRQFQLPDSVSVKNAFVVEHGRVIIPYLKADGTKVLGEYWNTSLTRGLPTEKKVVSNLHVRFSYSYNTLKFYMNDGTHVTGFIGQTNSINMYVHTGNRQRISIDSKKYFVHDLNGHYHLTDDNDLNKFLTIQTTANRTTVEFSNPRYFLDVQTQSDDGVWENHSGVFNGDWTYNLDYKGEKISDLSGYMTFNRTIDVDNKSIVLSYISTSVKPSNPCELLFGTEILGLYHHIINGIVTPVLIPSSIDFTTANSVPRADGTIIDYLKIIEVDRAFICFKNELEFDVLCKFSGKIIKNPKFKLQNNLEFHNYERGFRCTWKQTGNILEVYDFIAERI